MKKTEWNFKGKGNTKRKKNSIKNEYKTCATKNCAVNNTHTKLERISVTPESHLEFFKNLISHFRLTSSVFILFYLFVSTLEAWCAAHFLSRVLYLFNIWWFYAKLTWGTQHNIAYVRQRDHNGIKKGLMSANVCNFIA